MYPPMLLCLSGYSSHCIVNCIGLDYGQQGYIEVFKDQGTGKFLFEHIEGVPTSRSTRQGFIFRSRGCQRYSYLCKSLNEPSVEVCKPQQLLNNFELSQNYPILNFFYFLFGHLYALFSDYITKKLNYAYMEDTLFQIYSLISIVQLRQYFLYEWYMFVHILGIYQYVIELHYKSLI